MRRRLIEKKSFILAKVKIKTLRRRIIIDKNKRFINCD